MKSQNINGFNVVPMELKDFLQTMDDKEMLEVLKVEGYTFLYRMKTSEIYAVGEPESNKELTNESGKVTVR